ncbi:MAG: RrF2 family transcriptional regulator [Halanaerobiales bacterium]
MKISTQGRYGLRALVDLAKNNNSGAIPLREISERQDISERYLEQLFAKLRKSGIVRSVRGAHGGYLLNKPLAEITAGDVIRILEGTLAPVECVDEAGENCQRNKKCVTHEIWSELKKLINDYLDSITLADLKERTQELEQENGEGYMYYI